MEEKIQGLFESINFIGFNATYQRSNKYIENSKDLLPAIWDFVEWFMGNQEFGFEKEVYDNLIDILKDCEDALKEHDNVLMIDALEQGISGYLEMFLPKGYFREREASYAEGIKG